MWKNYHSLLHYFLRFYFFGKVCPKNIFLIIWESQQVCRYVEIDPLSEISIVKWEALHWVLLPSQSIPLERMKPCIFMSDGVKWRISSIRLALGSPWAANVMFCALPASLRDIAFPRMWLAAIDTAEKTLSYYWNYCVLVQMQWRKSTMCIFRGLKL